MSRRRRVGTAALVVVTGLLGAWIGVTLVGGTTRDVGPFRAELTLRPGAPGTVVDIPPLGELRLDTHRGVVGLRAEVVRVDRDEAQALLSDPDRLARLGDEVASDVEAGLRVAVLRTGTAAVVGALLLGGLALRRPRRVLLAGAVGVAACAVSGGVAAASFDRRAIAEPRFTGLLAYAPSAVGDVRALTDRFGDYSRQLGRLAANVSALYSTTSTLPAFEAGAETVRVLHISDLHLNPAAWDVVRSVVAQFDVDVVVDTGDLTDRGSFAEDRYADPIATLGVPYAYVRGNHDSSATEAAVRRQPGAVVLDGSTVEVGGIRVLGTGDPRFTPDKTTGDDDAPREVLLAVGEQLALAAQTGAPPALVAVHDAVMAEPLHGRVPLVLAGHRHRRIVEEEEGTRVLIQGSTGGAGLRALENDEPTPVTLTVLYLDPVDHSLEAYDDITLGGLGTSEARIVRTVVESLELASGRPSG